MRNYLLIATLLLFAFALKAQDTIRLSPYCTLNGATSLNFVQSSFSSWAAGGENSVSGAAGGTINMLYKKEKLSWENNLSLGYGLTFMNDERRKNDDKIDFASKLGYTATKHWKYSFLAGLKTQFDKGYASYPVTDHNAYVSKFFAPAYLILSPGMDYQPNSDFSLFISPVTGRFTFVCDDVLSQKGAFGVDPGKNLYTGFGAYLKNTYTKKIQKNIVVGSILELFSDYLSKPQNIAVNWQLSADLKVTKYISAKLQTQMIYDDKVKMFNTDGTESGPKVQFRQVLGVGFSYIF